MQPIDTLKVLRQSNQPLPNFIKNPSHYYKGITPFVSQMSVKYTLRFTAYETLKGETFSRNFLAGIAAGFTESLFITPFELVKTNLQTTNENRPTEVVKNIIKLKGISGLYRGFFSTFLRQGINQTLNFSIYHHFKTNYFNNNTDSKPQNSKIILSSLISSSIGPILNNPFDIVKTRYMNPKYNYKSISSALDCIIKNEGFLHLFNGLGLRLFRVSGGQVIIFTVVENLMHHTKK